MNALKTALGVIAAVGALSLPAAAVYMMVGFGYEAFTRAEAARDFGSCILVPAQNEHSGVVG